SPARTRPGHERLPRRRTTGCLDPACDRGGRRRTAYGRRGTVGRWVKDRSVQEVTRITTATSSPVFTRKWWPWEAPTTRARSGASAAAERICPSELELIRWARPRTGYSTSREYGRPVRGGPATKLLGSKVTTVIRIRPFTCRRAGRGAGCQRPCPPDRSEERFSTDAAFRAAATRRPMVGSRCCLRWV